MSLEEEISFEEMHSMEIKNIASLIKLAYIDANNKKSYSKYATIKSRWEYMKQNSEKDHFLIYVHKYNHGDESVRKPLQDYLVTFLESEMAYKNGLQRAKLATKEIKMHYPIAASVILGISVAFNIFLAVPAFASFLVWYNKKINWVMDAKKAYINEAFSSVDIERLKELPKEYLNEAMTMADLGI